MISEDLQGRSIGKNGREKEEGRFEVAGMIFQKKNKLWGGAGYTLLLFILALIFRVRKVINCAETSTEQ